MLIREIVQHSLLVGFGKNIRDPTQAFSNLLCLSYQPEIFQLDLKEKQVLEASTNTNSKSFNNHDFFKETVIHNHRRSMPLTWKAQAF